MLQVKLLFVVSLAGCLSTHLCSQTNSTRTSTATDVFVGSTPCGDFIKQALKIPGEVRCDFIKWEVSFYKSNNDSNTFQLTALYGESQPNTNGFIGGGKNISVTGKYTLQNGVNENRNLKVYSLNGDKLESAISLVEMDNNILHFVDDKKSFIVGNGGWGYVLNRLQ